MPVGVWLDADTGTMARDKEGNIIVNSKGRVQVQQGGKGTNKAKSGTLAWRPGWHLGEYPDAKQFAVKDPVTGKAKSAFPAHFIFAECEIAADVEFKEIAEHAGFGKDENGNWTRLLIEDETFPLQEALDIQKDSRYNSNCGTY